MDLGQIWLRHDDVIKWKHFPLYWPFVRGIQRSLVNSPHKGQWREALMFSLVSAWINGWVNNREAGDLRRRSAHIDVTVMQWLVACSATTLPIIIVIWTTRKNFHAISVGPQCMCSLLSIHQIPTHPSPIGNPTYYDQDIQRSIGANGKITGAKNKESDKTFHPITTTLNLPRSSLKSWVSLLNVESWTCSRYRLLLVTSSTGMFDWSRNYIHIGLAVNNLREYGPYMVHITIPQAWLTVFDMVGISGG